MKRADLLVIMGAIWLGLGIAHGKVILSALACVAFIVADREGRRSRSAADEDESESESERWERDKRLGQRPVPGAERHLPPRPDVAPPPPPPSGGRR